MSSSETLVGDMPVDHWINRLVPRPCRPYLLLMRLDRPIGTWLLLLPCWWSISLAASGWGHAIVMMVLFAIGAIVMRGAGCTVNDIADRDFDGQVARTAARPLPSGDVTLKQSIVFLGLELAVGLLILLQLPPFAILLGVASLVLVFPYPLMKRITYWPQAWLGLTFNWGALLGWAAMTNSLAWPPVILYVTGVFWTLGYDTIYAHQDKDDDIQIGVKSTALRLGRMTPLWITGFYALTALGIIATGAMAKLDWPFYLLMLAAVLHLVWQVKTLDIDDSPGCLRRFKSNRDFGFLVLFAIIMGKLV